MSFWTFLVTVVFFMWSYYIIYIEKEKLRKENIILTAERKELMTKNFLLEMQLEVQCKNNGSSSD